MNIVVTRMNLQWNKLLSGNFVYNTIERMNKINRASLKNQSDQSFILLTLTDDRLFDFGNILDNETILKVPALNGGYNHAGIIQAIKNYVSKLKCKSVTITRLDTDDALHKNFIKNLKVINLKDNEYADIVSGFPCVDINTKKAYTSKKHPDLFTTQFTSFKESIKNFKCIPFAHTHTKIGQLYKGSHYPQLKAIQFIHNENHSTKIYSEAKEINIDLSEYGL